MKKKPIVPVVLLLFILHGLLFGCAGKGKDIKTIKGDPEILYRQGLERFNKRDYDAALEIFGQIKSSFPDSPPYTQWAEIKVGDCHFFKKEYVEAIAAYEEFRKTRPTHEDIPYVQYQIGMAYFSQMRTPDRDQTFTKKALSNFEYLVANTPPSLFTQKALEKIEVCKRQLGDHEFYIANFYYKQEKYQATVSRLKGLLETYPKRVDEDKTLFLLGKSYLELDQWEKAREAFSRIVSEYPRSSHYREARMILDQGIKGKIAVQKAKAKETKKKGTIEGEAETIALVRFDEEGRQPVLFKENKVESRSEEKKVLPPSTDKVDKPAIQKEVARDVTPPLIKYEEEGRRWPASAPMPPPKEELKVEIKPEDEKRTAALPPPPTALETKDLPEERKGLREEAPVKKEAEKVREKETLKKEAPGQSREVKLGETGEPIDITSDRVETFSRENLIVFKGNVMARQKDMVIYSDSIEALVFEDGKGIEKVVAGGNVKIQQGLRVASCQRAVFYNRDQRVILTGDPKVWEGENMVSGEEIIFDIAKDRIEVKGGPGGRGKVRVLPGGELEKMK
jgi:outer membrane protein assembly factor BamD